MEAVPQQKQQQSYRPHSHWTLLTPFPSLPSTTCSQMKQSKHLHVKILKNKVLPNHGIAEAGFHDTWPWLKEESCGF